MASLEGERRRNAAEVLTLWGIELPEKPGRSYLGMSRPGIQLSWLMGCRAGCGVDPRNIR